MTAASTSTSTTIRVPAGEFTMGSDAHYADEAPVHRRRVDAFLLDAAPVTNRDFARFVDATGHRTDAERTPTAAEHPGVPPALLVAGSAVFRRPAGDVDLDVPSWWEYVPGACWHAPEGPGSDVDARLDHPVVHVSQRDAQAYAAWAGRRLPTEAEWERAARAGADTEFAWGAELRPGGRWMANTWPGLFPHSDGREPGTTPVGSFPPNAWGLLDMIGNVWEWTTDRYAEGHRVPGSCCAAARPPVADPLAAGAPLVVLKGGSFLCAENHCRRYRPAARIPQTADGSASNIGFRCATDLTTREDLA